LTSQIKHSQTNWPVCCPILQTLTGQRRPSLLVRKMLHRYFFKIKNPSIEGRGNCVHASYRGRELSMERCSLLMHPFFDTDIGFCAYLRPEVMFAPENDNRTYAGKSILVHGPR